MEVKLTFQRNYQGGCVAVDSSLYFVSVMLCVIYTFAKVGETQFSWILADAGGTLSQRCGGLSFQTL